MTQQPHATEPSAGGPHQAQQGWSESQRPAGMTPAPTPGLGPTPAENSWAAGGVVFAGVLMLVHGILAILQGISLLADDDVWASIGDYVYKINRTGWGVILLCLGALAAGVGAFILRGAGWARMTGIFLASLNMLAQFLFLPYEPVWSVIMIGINFFVIWALAVYQPGKAAV
ncbi:hypothetical protein ACI2L1_04725 [Streptomyces sp. NPDC019531]|uniref:DUF7144 family membrane protein n=1 Tax=Streptomyces sp. NPDC019531 TaxID=3365062 RepID=UPI00384A5B06